MRASLLLSSICFVVFITLCDTSAVASTSSVEKGCVPCNENVCARVRIQCPTGTQPTPNFCKCTCECRVPPAPPAQCNPCAIIKCKRGYSCVNDVRTCTGRCEYRCSHCKRNPEPCNGITCGVDKFCIPRCNRCGYKCASKKRCPKHPCSGVSCGNNKKCVANFKECTHTCMSCIFACPLNYLPVCGSDGVTYGNECAFRAAKCKSKTFLKISHQGECKKRNCAISPCEFTKCLFGLPCVTDFTTCTAKCERGVECPTTPCAFTLCLVGTICVPDFKTCTAKCEPRECTTNPCASTTCLVGNKCVPDFKLCIGRCIPQDCPVNNPCDGITCKNGQRCVPNFGQCSYSCQAECNEDIRCIVAACTFSSPCKKGQKCLATCNGCVPVCEIKRVNTPKCPDVCIQIAKPVCGSDGVTYGNGCLLGIANCKSGGKITQVSEGPCPARQKFPRCGFPQNPKPSSNNSREQIICGSAITLFCKPDCKTCCVSPNTCGPDGFPKRASECGLDNPTEI